MEIVYRHQGYAVTRFGGAKPDGGIDLVLEKDGDLIAVQCKHWKNWKVRPDTVRAFRGAMADREIKQGILVITGSISTEAEAFALRNEIEIVKEPEIAALLQKIARFNPEVETLLSDPRKFCPKCESLMILRTNRKDASRFWGCSGYPRCRFTMPAADDSLTPLAA